MTRLPGATTGCQKCPLGWKSTFGAPGGRAGGGRGRRLAFHPSATVDRAMAEAGAAVIGNVTGWRVSYLP